MSVDVACTVRAYEVEGEETPIGTDVELEVRSHWNRDEMVVLVWPGGQTLTVLARSLKAAIDNATNTDKY